MKPPEADEAAADGEEGLVDLVAAVVADEQPLEVVQPGGGTWSPNGKRIAYRCYSLIGVFKLCTSRLDGTKLKRFPWRLGSAEPDWGTHP